MAGAGAPSWELHLHSLLATVREARRPGGREDVRSGASVYSGTLGRALSILHVSWAVGRRIAAAVEDEREREMLRAWQCELVTLAHTYLTATDSRSRGSERERAKPAFLCGTVVGRETLRAVIEQERLALNMVEAQDTEACRQRVVNAVATVLSFERTVFAEDRTVHEFMNGTAGFVYALVLLRRRVSPSVVPVEVLERVSNHLVARGQDYSFPSLPDGALCDGVNRLPLQYHWHEKMYLGAAHGLLGVIMSLLHVCDEFKAVGAACDSARRRLEIPVRMTMDYILQFRWPSGNLKSRPRSENDKLCQWCHGAPGLAMVLAKCAETLGEPMVALGGAGAKAQEKFWDRQAFILAADAAASVVKGRHSSKANTKGPGLCHGAAGDVYVLLCLERVTGLAAYRAAAVQMAEEALQQKECKNDRPFSLYEGISGLLTVVADLFSGGGGFMPGFELPLPR